MNSENFALADLGWRPFFASQLELEEVIDCLPVRVVAVHRDRIHVLGADIDTFVAPIGQDASDAATVGDWLLLDRATGRTTRLLDRQSLFKRRSPGSDRRIQLIAANVDTLFVVSSCNQDFNVARLERYLALAREADVTPVVVLTKADLTDSTEDYARAAARLLPGLLVETVDARDAGDTTKLLAYCGRGQTVALVGSSGVGKSTLVNGLTGETHIPTQGIREDDARGRHTTSGRALHRLPGGGWLIDTPGMRELQLAEAADGITEVFEDVTVIAAACRFANCRHQGEPGCAIAAALGNGDLDPERVERWRKLAAEEAFNNESLSERRARSRAFGKTAKRAMQEKKGRRRE